jgi:Na+/H+ antiporter NhaB
MVVAFMIAIVTIVAISVYGKDHRQHDSQHVRTVASTDALMDQTITVQSSGMIMVDRVVLKSLIEDAKRQGTDLNVAIYEYDKKMEVWNRAEKWCK